MRNRNVGYLIIGLALIIGIIIFIFNNAMTSIVSTSCSHGPSCTMYDTIETQSYISLSIAGLVLLIGLFFVFSKESETIVVKTKTITKTEKKKPISLEGLDSKEKQAIQLLQKQGAMFQADLMEKLEIGKVGLTRLLDKLEAKQLIERKRRGMNNIVMLK